jgi:hypothetical protein
LNDGQDDNSGATTYDDDQTYSGYGGGNNGAWQNNDGHSSNVNTHTILNNHDSGSPT